MANASIAVSFVCLHQHCEVFHTRNEFNQSDKSTGIILQFEYIVNGVWVSVCDVRQFSTSAQWYASFNNYLSRILPFSVFSSAPSLPHPNMSLRALLHWTIAVKHLCLFFVLIRRYAQKSMLDIFLRLRWSLVSFLDTVFIVENCYRCASAVCTSPIFLRGEYCRWVHVLGRARCAFSVRFSFWLPRRYAMKW